MIVTGICSIDEMPLFVSVNFNVTISVKLTLYFWCISISQLDKEGINTIQWLLMH